MKKSFFVSQKGICCILILCMVVFSVSCSKEAKEEKTVEVEETAVIDDGSVLNFSFDSDLGTWNVYNAMGGDSILANKDGKLALDIAKVGGAEYAVQLFVDAVPLYQNGVYRITYEIASTVEREVEFRIQENGRSYQAYTGGISTITSEPTVVDYEFTMEQPTDMVTRLAFNCGYTGVDIAAHTISIDNLKLELVDDSNVTIFRW